MFKKLKIKKNIAKHLNNIKKSLSELGKITETDLNKETNMLALNACCISIGYESAQIIMLKKNLEAN